MASPIDIAIVGVFFAVIFFIGLYERKRLTVDDYWVNNRQTGKLLVAITTISTFLGVAALVSNAGIAFSGGGLATSLLLGSFLVYFIIFGKFFAPKIKEFGDTHGAYTVPDFLAYTYSNRVRIAGTLLILMSYGFSLALQVLGIGIFVSAVLPAMNPILATIAGGGVIVAYTAVGGLRADIRTDVFQFIVMLFLIFVFLPIVFVKGGGVSAIAALPSTFLWGQEFAPWYVFIFGFLFLGASNIVAADIWQRVYAADTKKGVEWAMKYAGVIVFLFLVMGTLFGIFGKIVVPGAAENTVIPALLQMYVPPVLFGLIVAGFFAAIMSSADTVLLILSMTLVHDLYNKALGKPLTPAKTLTVSRLTTAALGAVAVTVAVTIPSVVHLAINMISFFVALLPAVVFGFYTKGATEPAAFWSIVAGFITTVIFLFISPVEAFIPAIVVSFLVWWVVNTTAKKYSPL